MNNNIIKEIEKLKLSTSTNISQISSAKVPTLADIEMERRYSFKVHGFFHSFQKENSMLFVVKGLPFTHNKQRHVYHDSLENMVNNKEMYPFLLFINNKFIKWSKIEIINDCKYTYLLINNFMENEYNYKFITIPDEKVKYREDNDTISDKCIFAFNNNGLLVNKKSYEGSLITFELDNPNIYFERKIIGEHKKINTDLDPKYKLLKENLFIFCRGKFYDDCNSTFHGLNTISIEDERFQYDILEYILFYYLGSNENKDNLMTIDNKQAVINDIINNFESPDYILKLKDNFDFNYNNKDKYENNILKSLKYIMNYNPLLMENVYKNLSKIESKYYTGKQLKNLMNDKNIVTMSTRIDNDINNKVIIFHNGLLYNHYIDLEYKNKNFSFPILDVEDDDIFEIMYFKQIDNTIQPLFLSSIGDDTHYFGTNINMDIMNIFTTNPEHRDFRLQIGNSLQYLVEYEWERIEEYKYKIIPSSPFYYDKNLSLVSERQFKYMGKVVKEHTICVALPDEFKYCFKESNYIIFRNGRKLDKSNYRITITKTTRPFDDISIYTNIPLDEGDKLEVFYTPESIEEVYTQDKLQLSGNLIIQKTNLPYPFSKNLYFVFVNGRKMNINDITNIDSTKIKIKSNLKSTNNISVLRFIKNEDILNALFNENDDLLTSIISSIPLDKLEQLYPNSNNANIEEDMKQNKVDMKAVMHKLISDYWLRPGIDQGTEMVYDFDESELDKDENGNIILPYTDCSEEYQI